MTEQDRIKYVTERDLAILHFIGLFGLAAEKSLKAEFWTNSTLRTCQKHLMLLVRLGLLEKHFISIRTPGEAVYVLTKAAIKKFAPYRRIGLSAGLPVHRELKQQLIAQATMLKLKTVLAAEGKVITNWQNEHFLRSEARKALGGKAYGLLPDIPDARFMVGLAGTDSTILSYDVEIDGDYYGQMLTAKVKALAKTGRQTVWVTKASRATRIEGLVRNFGAWKVQVLALEEGEWQCRRKSGQVKA